MADHKQWMEITNRMFEQAPFTADAICSHGWGDLHDETIAFIAALFTSTNAKKIILNGAEEYERGGRGFTYWKDRLQNEYHIEGSLIIPTVPAKQTHEEAEGFADILASGSYRTVALVSVPQHILRAFLTNLAVAHERKLPVTFIPRSLPSCDWNEKITIKGLFNDTESTTRLGRFAAEIARSMEYRKRFLSGEQNFSIASVEEGLEYLSKH